MDKQMTGEGEWETEWRWSGDTTGQEHKEE